MTTRVLADLPKHHANGERIGITSVCSAHPLVIEAALRQGKSDGSPVLIEATCNQVNQEGGYTGMTPADFRSFVEGIADKVGFARTDLILGGDHLGPNPWKHLAPDEAIGRARAMVAAYVAAGFTKIHLDTSMGCAGESVALPDAVTAERAADLAAIAEGAVDPDAFAPPVYVIGTEVPVPGGALEALDHLQVTSPEAALETVEIHRRAFAARNLEAAFDRAIGLVVQPGVEFGNEDVITYVPEQARALSGVLTDMPSFVFEAHSTDYQPPEALAALVRDGFAILKVGPGLTFALREALYSLDLIAADLEGRPGAVELQPAMERLMVEKPDNWRKYYHGTEGELRLQRHFSYSDRIRYYWPDPAAAAAVGRLEERLAGRTIPETLISQHLAALYPGVASGEIDPRPSALLIAAVQRVLSIYGNACRSGG
ncbi:D-tagatose-bisphosphate aldolase, class II, non-catalytic subunit [Amaricoccus solimangrovi]|uniref:D-tagatose-bisphosphate aldolase, class II, non-catalytic subunit n=1 Tax=Amaricoccus solimangrovi TaxID=2589815 RepID=A0A501W982_9RHOB|nr:D-tagatose-bisphosphate aldolase, class II, non-catalytic subunit [Amaricoccus solimangrovi]TPE45095.1 D-tagatose-bisphosphate aldolase, class II, non-catalytic subunit [Amaricoccus solimangrovi]